MITAIFLALGIVSGLACFALFLVARGAIHEIGAIVCFLTTVLCLGVAAISAQLARIIKQLEITNARPLPVYPRDEL